MTDEEATHISDDIERWNENPWWNVWEDIPEHQPQYCAMCREDRPIYYVGLFGIRYGGPFYRAFCFECGCKIQSFIIKMDCKGLHE